MQCHTDPMHSLCYVRYQPACRLFALSILANNAIQPWIAHSCHIIKIISNLIFEKDIPILFIVYHDDVITNLEPDILECEVKWALESITMKKLVEVMEFQWSSFKSWKMMLWKCCTQYASTFGKLSSGHRIGKGQFSFQSQRKAMPKNAQTTAQPHSSHMLAK